MNVLKIHNVFDIFNIINQFQNTACAEDFIRLMQRRMIELTGCEQTFIMFIRKSDHKIIHIFKSEKHCEFLDKFVHKKYYLKYLDKNLNIYHEEQEKENFGIALFGKNISDCQYISIIIYNAKNLVSAEYTKNIFDLLLPFMHITLMRLNKSDIIKKALIERLTPRESEILSWISHGKTNNEIGIILGISTFTVKNHVSNILGKLDVPNRSAALAMIH